MLIDLEELCVWFEEWEDKWIFLIYSSEPSLHVWSEDAVGPGPITNSFVISTCY